MAIVATKVDVTSHWSFENIELESITKAFYDLQIFYANLTNITECRMVCEHINRLIKISTLQYNGLNSLLLKTLEGDGKDTDEAQSKLQMEQKHPS
ncbi:hypothetical protein G6F57_000100 [Rhizopus arrhizus]|uniref:Uncharacterized protein n=1 Tax=Rhizopus oryzae TaxID=64495 RepID=A0A9P7BXI0_RHIOR|nr:hypothetical protein G6F23_000003 [Rhizopus arrhizus]KAG1424775.1 hypothetical protein G6F58_002227 [Rhizopus delemar]KAG0770506.1 hypothetical protein G6F24_000159 [Rhizopus arrhizus]KAG0797986.1 hypothetical protein G6F21_000077 [Rhizopus arrhizus]KAG0802601.1 hypothetical protein G6F22_000104 [Rhizopus arrhizus]